MKRFLLPILVAVAAQSCYDDNKYDPSVFSDIMVVNVENDNVYADGISQITISVEFPAEFNTEDDTSVTYRIEFKDKMEEHTSPIQFIEKNDEDKKIATLKLKSKQAGIMKIEAEISVNQSVVIKDTTVTFKKALPEKIKISSSAYSIKADSSFKTIDITIALQRDSGTVSQGVEAGIKVISPDGTMHGFLDLQQFTSDSAGKIKNKFTTALDPYLGPLWVIGSSENEDGNPLSDTLMVYTVK